VISEVSRGAHGKKRKQLISQGREISSLPADSATSLSRNRWSDWSYSEAGSGLEGHSDGSRRGVSPRAKGNLWHEVVLADSM